MPQLDCLLPAGFLSPVDAHTDAPFDLTRLLVQQLASMFLPGVSRDLMVEPHEAKRHAYQPPYYPPIGRSGGS